MDEKYKSHLAEEYINKLENFVAKRNIKEIIILGTGPTLENGIQYIKKIESETLVISIKQSILRIKNFQGKVLHLLNPWNLQKYKYINQDVLTLYFDEHFTKFKLPKKHYDLFFITDFVTNPLENSVLSKKEFSNWAYTNKNFFSEKRPVMPGIFGEALYLSLFFEPEKIRIFGVDYTSTKGIGNKHFYDLPVFLNKTLKFITRIGFFQKIFYELGMRTQYSHASEGELNVAIPGYTDFIRYICEKHKIKVYGWQH